MTHDRNSDSVQQESLASATIERDLLSPKSIREQVEHVAADPLFFHSKRYSTLLKHIVDRTLDGDHDSLKERIIGIDVFGKAADFDASLDSTVRVAAAEVRKRLTVYYSDPAHTHELHIELPTRSYIAEFRAPEASLVVSAAAPAQSSRIRFYAIIASALLILLIASAGLYRFLRPASAMERFWAPLLDYDGPVAISVGSPPNSTLPDPSVDPGSYAATQAHADFPLFDLQTATAVTSYLGVHGKASAMRFAQTTTLAELKNQPVVLIGSHRNDWSMLLGGDFRFRFRANSTDGTNWIEDATNPADHRWLVNRAGPFEKTKREYALVTRAMAKSTGQWWIGIGGLTGAGTYAAQLQLLDPREMENLARQLPKDWERKNLQIILEVPVINGSPGAAHLVAAYDW